MKIGFIGLGNVGGKLANSLLRNKFDLTVRDVEKNLTNDFKSKGAKVSDSAKKQLAVDVIELQQEILLFLLVVKEIVLKKYCQY